MGRATIPKGKYESKEEFLSRLQKASYRSSSSANNTASALFFVAIALFIFFNY